MSQYNDFDFKDWFDQEVKELEKDPEYIANGLMIEMAAQVSKKLQDEGLKQKDLAEKLGKSEGWISRFMNAPTNFSVKKLVEIGVALGMNLEVKFKDPITISNVKPKTITGKSRSGPNRQFNFGDSGNRPQRDTTHNKLPSDPTDGIAA